MVGAVREASHCSPAAAASASRASSAASAARLRSSAASTVPGIAHPKMSAMRSCSQAAVHVRGGEGEPRLHARRGRRVVHGVPAAVRRRNTNTNAADLPLADVQVKAELIILLES